MCAACVDKTLHLLSAASGARTLPAFVLDSKIHKLRCSGYYVLAVTSRGTIYVWYDIIYPSEYCARTISIETNCDYSK